MKHHTDFEPTAVTFAKTPAKTSRGSKIVYVNFADGQRVRMQTPVMTAPFGISSFDEATGGKTYTLDGSFKGFESNKFLAGFLEKCRGLDAHLAEEAAKNSPEWFGKKMSLDVVHEMIRRVVRDPSDPKYAPTVRMKIATDLSGKPSTQFFDEKGQPVGMEYLTKGCSFRAIVELSSVWFVQKSFGVSLRLVQVAVTSRPANAAAQESLNGFAFIDGEGDDVFAMDDDINSN